MTNIQFDKPDLKWGEITETDILRRMHNKKIFEQMDEKEINQMLEDLI